MTRRSSESFLISLAVVGLCMVTGAPWPLIFFLLVFVFVVFGPSFRQWAVFFQALEDTKVYFVQRMRVLDTYSQEAAKAYRREIEHHG